MSPTDFLSALLVTRDAYDVCVLSFNGWGVTVYDSLDTMFLMNLTAEFDRAVSVVAKADFSIPFVRCPYSALA